MFNNVNKAQIQTKLPLDGVWNIMLYMTTDDKNQGSVLNYIITFKQNSLYSVMNKQELHEPIRWGFGLQNTDPIIDDKGNFSIEYRDTNGTNRVKWTIKLKAKRIFAM